jgi:Lon protease-like protein
VADGAFDPKRFSGKVPLFPLPNVVLFPGMFLPLHIFEPRYRQMTRDALQGERLLAMALLKPGWQADYEGTPAIHPVVGVGKIIEHTKLEDGKYNLVLLGLARARVIEESAGAAYRTATVEVLEDPPEAVGAHERRRRTLLTIYAQIMKQLTEGGLPAPPEDVPLGLLTDLVTSLLSIDLSVRQELLEELDPEARCDRLLRMLESAPGPSPEGPPRPRRPWPRGPSHN